jgi:hypothetical protein
MNFDVKPSQCPRRKQEDQAAAEGGRITEECGQIVNIRRAGAGSSGIDCPDDRVVPDVPKQGAGGAAHPEAPPEELRQGRRAVDEPRDPPLGNQVHGGSEHPLRDAPTLQHRGEPGPSQALERFGLVGEQDGWAALSAAPPLGRVRPVPQGGGSGSEKEIPDVGPGIGAGQGRSCKVTIGFHDVRATVPTADGGLVFGEAGFEAGAKGISDGGPEQAPEARGKLEGTALIGG